MSAKPNIRLYLFIFGALLFLTIVTVLVSYLELPMPAAILVALFIATLKASLVAAFFMHLKGERFIIYGLLGITVFFVAFLFTLPASDEAANAKVEAHAVVQVPHVP